MSFTSFHTNTLGKWSNNGGKGKAVECGYNHKNKEVFITIVDEYMRGAKYEAKCLYSEVYERTGAYSKFEKMMLENCNENILKDLIGRVMEYNNQNNPGHAV